MIDSTQIELLNLIKDGLIDGEIQQGFTAGDLSGYTGVELAKIEEALASAVSAGIAVKTLETYTFDTAKDIQLETEKANLLAPVP